MMDAGLAKFPQLITLTFHSNLSYFYATGYSSSNLAQKQSGLLSLQFFVPYEGSCVIM